jgi:hypothetical protein
VEGQGAPALLTAKAAARHLGIGIDRFRRIVDGGNGPRSWNPDGGRPMWSTKVLDEWAAARDDRRAA